MEWRVEDRFYLNVEQPKLNAWVVYNQFARWSAAVFDRALESTVFERDENDLESAKRVVEGFISRYYSKEIAPDRWVEALTPRSDMGPTPDLDICDSAHLKNALLS